MAAVKHPPYMFMFMVLLELLSSFSHLKIRVPLKPLLGGVIGVAQVITSHEQTKKTSLLFSFLWCGPCFQSMQLIIVGLVCCLVIRDSTFGFHLLALVMLFGIPKIFRCHNTSFLSSPHLWFTYLSLDFFVSCVGSLIHWWISKVHAGLNVSNHFWSGGRGLDLVKLV